MESSTVENRILSIQGNSEEAIREYVKRDLSPVLPIVYEVGLKPLEVPLPERRFIMNHLLRSNPYFLGLAQWTAHPDDLSYATEWFERYLKTATNWKLQPDDIIHVVTFARELEGFKASERLPFQAKLFELLSPKAQEAVKKDRRKRRKSKSSPRCERSLRRRFPFQNPFRTKNSPTWVWKSTVSWQGRTLSIRRHF